MVKATKAAEKIPINDTREIAYSAGCLANIMTPTLAMVVMTERIMEVLWVGRDLIPV